jgi:uncharacterized membrane protein
LKSNSKWRISKIPYFNEFIYIHFINNMLIFYLDQVIEAEYNGKISHDKEDFDKLYILSYSYKMV